MQEWVILSISALGAVAGFLAIKVVKHGELLAGLCAKNEGMSERFDRQDDVLGRIDEKVQALALRMGIRPSPYPEKKER